MKNNLRSSSRGPFDALATRLAWVLAAGWILSSAVLGAEYWVGPGGRDSATTGGRTRPWATLQYAADHARSGDTIHVLDGDYTGFDLRHGGTAAAPIVFLAEGKQVRIARRNRKTPDGINIEGCDHVVVDGFVINEMPRAGVRGAVGSHLTIRRVRAAHNGSWGIFIAHCDDVAIVQNQLSHSVKEHGIYVSNSGDRPEIRGNVCWGNRGSGIHMNGDLSQGGDGIISGAIIANNVVFENGKGGGSGINCDGVRDSKFQNNLLYNNHASGLSLYRVDGAGGGG